MSSTKKLIIFVAATGAILNAQQSPCSVTSPRDRGWSRFVKAANPFSRQHALGSLCERSRPEDIPKFIELLDCTAPIGREGDTVQEILIDELQRSIPVEYEGFTLKRFLANSDYRNEIKSIYKSWWQTNKSSATFDKSMSQFRSHETKKAELEHHRDWYLALVTSRI